jgi:glycosyltransferase involved in cell wall biosynthesis
MISCGIEEVLMLSIKPTHDSLKDMLISVVIPTYNAASFLPEAIESVRRQTRSVDEIIIVDDGSTDNTEQVVHQLGPDITLIRQSNAGPAVARNLGIAAAKGKYIAFLDADDQWLPNKIERQMRIMERFPEVALIASDMAETDAAGKIIVPSVLDRHGMLNFFSGLGFNPVPQAVARLVNKNFIPTGTVIAKKTALLEVGAFNASIRYGEDLELWVKLAARNPIICLADVYLLRRQHASNVTKSNEPLLIDLVKVMRSLRQLAFDDLVKDGVNPDRLVADSLADLGYWYFVTERQEQARKIFFESLMERFNLRAFTYCFASALPQKLVLFLRSIKQNWTKKGR